jgi:Predicted transmembrane transcriptional regulator (anti-sigma factor)
MNTKCYDIGTIQAFLDGELSSDIAARVTNHISACDACAASLAEAEEESAVVFSALEREFNTLVPTQRLWSKINDSIIVEKQRMPFLQKIWTAITANLGSPSFAAAASVLIVFGIFAAVWGLRSGNQTNNITVPPLVQENIQVAKVEKSPEIDFPVVTKTTETHSSITTPVKVERADYRRNRTDYQVIKAVQPVNNAADSSSRNVPSSYLPGEESYVKTITNLSQSVADQKDTAMRPSERISYERDMAVVNDSIKKMRDEVRKNPKNDSAKQVLYSSYQNKIDLLNSVAQKEELVASLK